jgi:hypothetical protein
MTTRQAVALAPVLVAVGLLAGCGTGSSSTVSHRTAATVGSQNSSPTGSVGGSPAAPVASPAAPVASPVAPVSDSLACGTVVDATGYKNGPLTTNLAVAFLTDMELTDGVANIPAGTPSSADTNILDSTATELENYSGNKLSDDAEQFSEDEQGYNPDGPVDISYAQPLFQDILTLEKDCPQGTTLGEQWRNEGS